MLKKPENWDECVMMIDAPELRLLLRVRTLQLAFNSDSSVAIKAIEMLQSTGGQNVNRPLKDIPTDALLEMRARVERRLIATAGALGNAASQADD